MMTEERFNVCHAHNPRRDAYGFALRPQYVQTYKEYAHIYKEEEDERSDKWKNFLEHIEKSSQSCSLEKAHTEELPAEATEQKAYREELQAEPTEQKAEIVSESDEEGNDKSSLKSISEDSSERDPKKEAQLPKETGKSKVQTWTFIRSSLSSIENMMSIRVRKQKNMKDEHIVVDKDHLPSIEEVPSQDAFEDGQEEDIYLDASNGATSVSNRESDGLKASGEDEVVDGGVCNSVQADQTKEDVANGIHPEPLFPWSQELESLVHGGVPRDLRGEVWQAFVGVKARRVEKYYYDLLAEETNTGESMDNDNSCGAFRKWRKQIEKDIPRTFPGHPALDENGRNSLRRLLLAYARHNPSVGYCQAMNFFAGLLLLLMPEENAFWTLVGIIDDYFDGYYTEEMIESQVDQLVFEELVREKFPKLVNHLDFLGVQVGWIIGPWFLSIFVNMIPWESVIRVWDVLLFEGNRVMLFRTALALLELYGPAIVTTKDAGDAIVLFQSLVGSTFDSSQLVLTACMGFLAITETRLKELRDKHRPTVLEVVEERARAKKWKDSKGLSAKLYSFKHDPTITEEKSTTEEESANGNVSQSKSDSCNLDEMLNGLSLSSELDSLSDPQDQVDWLKVELCRVLEEKRSSVLRSEELETALMEIVRHDNRRELSAKVEQLEHEVAELHQALEDKTEQESAMLKVLMLVEQEQKVTEEARISAEQEAITQKHALYVLQEKYDKAMSSLTEMEKRVKVAESMLEATLQYESGQAKALSPRSLPGSTQGNPTRKIPLLSFGLGWRDRIKRSNDSKSTNEQSDPPIPQEETTPTPQEKTSPTPQEKTGEEVQEHVEGK
ncbi:uncharacterized protein LOC133720852 isoform X1 [Rosa rugosa]|uniref:uncharacterized protein LOC133720852 isoform X1 n=1 Tax=Rosa rugosa TaxID=74645 RepID=UPI002B4088C2|nr:uncharacterized protein LOC133720852 isoform X1 [Rosa rugosa]